MAWGLALVVISVNLFVICLMYLNLQQSKEQYESRAVISSQNIAGLLEQNIKDAIAKIELSVLALEDTIEWQMAGGGIDKSLLNKAIIRHHSRMQGLDGIRITDARGIVRYGINVAKDSKISIAEDEHFPYLRDHPDAGTIISKPKFGKISKKWTVKVVRRYNYPDGSFGGVISGIIDLEYFSKLFSGVNVGPKGIINLRDGEMGLLVRYPELDVTGNAIGNKELSQQFLAALRKNPYSGTFYSVSRFDDIRRTISYHKVGTLPLSVQVGLSTDDSLQEWRREVRNGIATAIIFLLISLLISWVYLRSRQARQAMHQAAREGHETLHSILETTLDGYWCTDSQGNLLDVNQAYCKLSGYQRGELLGMQIQDLEAALTPSGIEDRIHHSFKYGSDQFETRHRRKDGSVWDVEVSLTYRDSSGGRLFVFMRDITERKRFQEELRHIASTDDLTGVISRRHFMELAQNELRRSIRLRYDLAIALIDVDHFKQINDSIGHAAGDQVLQTLADVFQQNIREIDVFARMGGDEFVLLLPGASSEQAYEVVERSRQALAEQRINFSGQMISVTISSGIASVSSDGDTFDAIMSRADQAMYKSKQTGRNRVTVDTDLV